MSDAGIKGRKEVHKRMDKSYLYKKIPKKRETLVTKLIYIFQPFVIFLVMKTMAMLGLSLLIATLPLQEIKEVSAVVNAIASIIAVLFIRRDFLTEVDINGEVDIDKRIGRQFIQCMEKGAAAQKGKGMMLAVIASLAITTSQFFNGVISCLQIQSGKYENVGKIQYAVPIWLGLILYGLVSPIVEEIVFRGVTYHRMRRFYGLPVCVIVTSILFGGFHANLPQFIYGVLMGCIMALCYEWNQTFFAPVLFHMTANIFVFVTSHIVGVQEVTATVPALLIFGILSLILFMVLKHHAKMHKKID